MRIKQDRPGILNVTLSAYEMSTLISAARWIQDGAKGEVTGEALHGIRQVLADYDRAAKALYPEKN